MAVSMYANDHADYYPKGYTGNGDWLLFICPYMQKECSTYVPVFTNSPVFICPTVQTPPGKTTRSTYSAHIALMGGPGNPPPFDGHIKRSKVVRPGELILVADGNMGRPAYDTSSAFDALANFGMPMITPTQPYNPSAPDNDNPIPASDVGPNYDPGTSGGLGYIRWRHSGNQAANFLFCDGHAESLAMSQVKKRNLRYDP
jgi:prepilin-type processing-associated H-X9-DG protein